MPKSDRSKEIEEIFEDMFESQVQEFMDQHSHLINQEANIFKMASRIEERYNYVIQTAREQNQRRIETVKEHNQILYETVMNNREKLLKEELSHVQDDIKASIKEHNEITKKQEEIIENEYLANKNNLLKKIMQKLELDFS